MSITLILGLIGNLVLGVILGGVYFTAMWWSAELFAAGGRVTLALVLVAGRFVLIVAVLVLVATHHGALPLLATAFGILCARFVAVRHVKALAT
jgi:F1F0 ATPase subunit 2